MLEDEQEDIIGKAMRGKGLSWQDLEIQNRDLSSLEASDLVKVASKLELSATCLENLTSPFETTQLPLGVEMITSQFGHLGVNAFHLSLNGLSILIDTGTEAKKLSHLQPDYVLITHEHPDHLACLSSLSGKVLTPSNWSPIPEAEIKTFDVSGHCSPSLAYYFPEKEVCFVGDAIFRRSMGGCRSHAAYQQALYNVRKMLAHLPPETILCVGHGPNTTVKEELKENPFFA